MMMKTVRNRQLWLRNYLKKHLETYEIMCLELIHYQSSIKEGPAAGKADEYWKMSCAIQTAEDTGDLHLR